jgi:hypothetical protein
MEVEDVTAADLILLTVQQCEEDSDEEEVDTVDNCTYDLSDLRIQDYERLRRYVQFVNDALLYMIPEIHPRMLTVFSYNSKERSQINSLCSMLRVSIKPS